MLFNFLEKFANNYNNLVLTQKTLVQFATLCVTTLLTTPINSSFKTLEKYKLVMLENYITIFNVPIQWNTITTIWTPRSRRSIPSWSLSWNPLRCSIRRRGPARSWSLLMTWTCPSHPHYLKFLCNYYSMQQHIFFIITFYDMIILKEIA